MKLKVTLFIFAGVLALLLAYAFRFEHLPKHPYYLALRSNRWTRETEGLTHTGWVQLTPPTFTHLDIVERGTSFALIVGLGVFIYRLFLKPPPKQ